MSRKLTIAISATIAAIAFGGLVGPVHASEGTSLIDCLKAGGHQSGKYCSGGDHDGKLIIG
jgi:hypothetical protein